MVGVVNVESRGMAAGGSSAARVRWLSDQEKAVLLSNFEKRGWIKGSSEGQINHAVGGFELSVGFALPVHGLSTSR